MAEDKLAELQELLKILEAMPFTGSRAYGLAVGNVSDDDRFGLPAEVADLERRLEAAGVELRPGGESGGESSKRFTLGGKEWNIFSVPPWKFEAMRAATAALRAIVGTTGNGNTALTDKGKRVLLFRMIVDVLAMDHYKGR